MRRWLVPVLAALALAAPAAAAVSDPAQIVPFSTQQLDAYWTPVLAARGKTYATLPVVEFTGAKQTPCGAAPEDDAFYCRLDRTVYLDPAMLHELRDYAMVAVLAHEWGHAMQDQLGVLAWALEHRFYLGKELQADCYAGTFTKWAEKRKLLQKGDLNEALRMLDDFGDLPFMYGRYSPGAHGTSAQRVVWFKRGYKAASVKACDAVWGVFYPKG